MTWTYYDTPVVRNIQAAAGQAAMGWDGSGSGWNKKFLKIYINMFQAVNPPLPPPTPPTPPPPNPPNPPPPPLWWGGGVVGWWGGGVVGWWGGGVVGWWGGGVVGWCGGVVGWWGGWVGGVWFGVGSGLVGWFRVGSGLVCGGFRVWVELGLGFGLRRGCRVVWFRVGCCERCWGVGSRGERGSQGPKLQGSHGTGQHPQHCQHHPQDADDAGAGGFVAQGLIYTI